MSLSRLSLICSKDHLLNLSRLSKFCSEDHLLSLGRVIITHPDLDITSEHHLSFNLIHMQ